MPNERILILDDDPLVGQTIALIAEGAGLEARSTSDPEAFFRELEEWNPTHIALDLVMPELDGVEVMQRLAERGCQANIVITSGVGSRVLDAARRSATEHGLNVLGVVSKPFSPATLREALGHPSEGSSSSLPRKSPESNLFEVTESEIRKALDQKNFYAVYQPKVNCDTGSMSGFEVLARWAHPEVGLIMPDRFIPVLESCGLIDEFTEQMFQQSLHWLAENYLTSDYCLAVNISAQSLVDFHLGDSVSHLCQQLMIDPGRLILELTETRAMEDAAKSLYLLTRLRMRGFQLAIDDFGTGYSSMLQLVRLPFSEIKVDKSFVMAALGSEESRTVVKSIIDLGHSLGLRTVAEGVEDQKTLHFLRSVGCDLAQGYYISRPMNCDSVRGWISEWQARTKVSEFTERPLLH